MELTTDRIAANRTNAQHSTGPRSEAGKARSRWNALTHGLYARTLTQSSHRLGQDLADYEALRDALMEDYAPECVAEARMIERMAQHCWRQDRLFIHTEQQLVADLEDGHGAVGVCLHAERMQEADTKLDRAISRIHRDLLFLARYRARTAEILERRQDRREPANPAQEASGIGDPGPVAELDADAQPGTPPSSSEPQSPEQEPTDPGLAAEPSEGQEEQSVAPAFVDPLARFFRPAPAIGSKEWYESIKTKPPRNNLEAGASASS